MMIFKKISLIIIYSLGSLLYAQTSLYHNNQIEVGAEKSSQYIPVLQNKVVGVVVNQSSLIKDTTVNTKIDKKDVGKTKTTHLVDFLLINGVKIKSIFSPEHGFRGKADAGEKVESGIDKKTNLPIISLYGSNKKPTNEQLKGIDVMIFDIQDVGARFYTYISTLHYVMEACAENDIELIVFDRPNPNGHYVDGPVLNSSYTSFVGMHPVPVVHGMTVGEYAQMINGEKWLKKGISCKLSVIKCSGWNHKKFYKLPIKPSPNLPNMLSIYLYPSLCFFEGTVVSVGRGTNKPFQVIGHPNFTPDTFAFIPKPTEGAKHLKLENKICYGIDFTTQGIDIIRAQKQLNISWLIHFYTTLNLNKNFFLKNGFFNLLAGNNQLMAQIIEGKSETEIRQSWQQDLIHFKAIRQKYLLYEDF